MASSIRKSTRICCLHEVARENVFTLRPGFKKVCSQALRSQDPFERSAKTMQNVRLHTKAFPCGWPLSVDVVSKAMNNKSAFSHFSCMCVAFAFLHNLTTRSYSRVCVCILGNLFLAPSDQAPPPGLH